MPRTFVWHPGRGPKVTESNTVTKGKVRIEQVRSGIGHSWRMKQTLEAIGLKHHQDVVVKTDSPVAPRTDQARASPGEGDAGEGMTMAKTKEKEHRRRAARPAQPARRAVLAPRAEAPRARPGLRHRQDVGQGAQGHQGAFGPPRPRRRQAALRGRPDAAHAPAAEARLHEPVPRGVADRAARRPERAPGGRRGDGGDAGEGRPHPHREGAGEAARTTASSPAR